MSGWKKLDPDALGDDPPSNVFEETGNGDLRALPQQADRSPAADPEKFIREIKGMLVGDEYAYAEETLRGILATVERTRHVTQGQYDAVDNIAGQPYRTSAYRSKRYRGY